MKLLIAPLHYVLDPSGGSEYSRAYSNLKYLSEQEGLSGDVLVWYAPFGSIGNFRIFRAAENRPAYISNWIRIAFIIWVFIKGRKLLREKDYNLIWHQGPFAIGETFNLLALLKPKHLPLVIGPIFNPFKNAGKEDFGLLGKKVLTSKSVFSRIFHRADYYAYRLAKIFHRLSVITLASAALVLTYDREALKLLRSLGIRKSRFIPIGIDEKPFLFAPKPDVFRDKIKLLSVNYLVERKRTQDVIGAVAQLIHSGVKNIILTIVGDGPQITELRRLVKKLNISSQVRFAGFIPRELLPRYYKAADVFVSASVEESMAGVYFEAMAASLPLVVVINSTTAALATARFGGTLVPPRSPQTLAIALNDLIRHPRKRFIYAKHNAKLMQKRYSYRNNMARLLACLDKLSLKSTL